MGDGIVPGYSVENALEFTLHKSDEILPGLAQRGLRIVSVNSYQSSATENLMEATEETQVHLAKLRHAVTENPFKRRTHVTKVIRPGELDTHHVGVTIKHVQDSKAAFRALPPGVRRCLYPEEVSQGYSEGDCFLECAWKVAAKRCQCAPWFLRDREEFRGSSTCEFYGNWCFKAKILERYDTNSEAYATCRDSCPLDCDRIKYESFYR